MNFTRFWFPAVLYSGIIFYISSLPELGTKINIAYFDKFLHISEYLPFGFLWARALVSTKRNVSGRLLFGFVAVLTFLYGVSDEYHQSFVPGRESTASDVAADVIGGLAGGVFFYFWRKKL